MISGSICSFSSISDTLGATTSVANLRTENPDNGNQFSGSAALLEKRRTRLPEHVLLLRERRQTRVHRRHIRLRREGAAVERVSCHQNSIGGGAYRTADGAARRGARSTEARAAEVANRESIDAERRRNANSRNLSKFLVGSFRTPPLNAIRTVSSAPIARDRTGATVEWMGKNRSKLRNTEKRGK